MRNFLNAVTRLFLASRCLVMPLFGAIGMTHSELFQKRIAAAILLLLLLPVTKPFIEVSWRNCRIRTSDLPDPNDKPNCDFGVKLGQILTLTSPCEVKLKKNEKRHYGLVPRVKLLDCANSSPHRTCRIQMTSQNVIFAHLPLSLSLPL